MQKSGKVFAFCLTVYKFAAEQEENMKDSALSIANYFIDLAQSQSKEIKPLRLMKLVYIAHGFMLAMLNRSVLNPRFDRVEAWKYGPCNSVSISFFQGLWE